MSNPHPTDHLGDNEIQVGDLFTKYGTESLVRNRVLAAANSNKIRYLTSLAGALARYLVNSRPSYDDTHLMYINRFLGDLPRKAVISFYDTIRGATSSPVKGPFAVGLDRELRKYKDGAYVSVCWLPT